MGEHDAASLLERLLHHMVHLVNSGESPMVVRKLCSALVAYYLQPATTWKRCIPHLMVCLAKGEVVQFKLFESSAPPTLGLPARLNEAQLLASLYFAATLAEEGKQTLVITTAS